MENGTTTSCRIWFTNNQNTLLGKVSASAGLAGSIVEIWMYRDTWSPPDVKQFKHGRSIVPRDITSIKQIDSARSVK